MTERRIRVKDKVNHPDKQLVPIDKNIPISEYYLAQYKLLSARHGGGRKMTYNYPLDTMEVGDSFAVPPRARVGDVRRLANSYGNIANKTFLTIRDDTHRYRVYRTA